jgi:hypothetical protein
MHHRAAGRLIIAGFSVLGCGLGAMPAQAQDLLAFLGLRGFVPPAVQIAPAYPAYGSNPIRAMERRVLRRSRPKAAPAIASRQSRGDPPPQMPRQARLADDVPNPVPQLLADRTLRPGDIVVFPDGPRVFKGVPGAEHALTDFKKVSEKESSSMRQLAKTVQVGVNAAWSTENLGPKLAENLRDVKTTGGISRTR